MSIVRGRLRAYAVPLAEDWSGAAGAGRERRGWVLALEDDQGRVGFGEAAPFPGFGLESHDAAGASLRLALPKFVGLSRDSYAVAIADLRGLAPVAAAPSARHAIDEALHDLIAQEMGVSLARYLGGAQALTEVPANATIPRVPPDRAAALGREAAAAGARTLKLKVGGVAREEDAARIRALREAVGPKARIRIDANQAWSVEDAIESLRSFAPYEIEYAEQPVSAEDIPGLARVRAEGGVPIAADESIHDLESAEAVLYRSAADVLILKPMVLGGLRAARSVLSFAQDMGVPVVVTSLLDGAVGRVAALHLAASLGPTPFDHGIATGGALRGDVASAPAFARGVVPVPDRPGLGVAPEPEFWSGAITVEAE